MAARVSSVKNAPARPAKIVIGRESSVGDIEAERKAIHEDIEIKCFFEGSSTLLVGSETVTVSAGDVVVINPYEFHATLSSGEKTGKYHLFMVPLDYFSGLGSGDADLRNLFFAENTVFCSLVKDPVIHGLLQNAVSQFAIGDEWSPMAVKGILTEVFALLLRSWTEKESSPFREESLREYRLVEPALRKMRDSFSEKLTVDGLAALCGLSKHYFCRVFKSVTGQTVMEYLAEYRMKVSDTMLANSDKSVSEIAALCGFESANYFCRCYKKRFGISPSLRRLKSTI